MNKILVAFITVLLVLITGCSNEIRNEGNIIVVEERVGEGDKYEHTITIEDRKEVSKVKEILDNISWGNSIVSMAYPPQYKFYFEDNSKNKKSSRLVYQLWVSPNKDKVELVLEGKYVQLSKEKSAELFKIITRKQLGEA